MFISCIILYAKDSIVEFQPVYILEQYMTENSQLKFKTAKQIDRQLNIPDLGIKTFVDFLRLGCMKSSSFVPCGCMRDQIEYNKAYSRAFNSLTRQERINHYYRVILLLRQCLEGDPTLINYDRQENLPKNGTFNFFNEKQKVWEIRGVDIDWNSKTMTFRQGGQVINFNHYLLRNSSKKDRKAFVLQSTENFQKPTTLRISHHKQTPDVLKELLQKLIMGAIKDYFIKSLSEIGRLPTVKSQIISEMKMTKTPTNKEMSIRDTQKVGSQVQLVSPTAFKKRKSLNSPTKKNEKQNKRNEIINSLTIYEGFNQTSKGVYTNLSQNIVRKVYEVKQDDDFKIPLEWFADNMILSSGFRNWKKSLREVKTLGEYQDSKIFYQSHQYKEKIDLGYLYKRQRYQPSENILYFFDLSIQNPHPIMRFPELDTRNTIQYVVWKFERTYRTLKIMTEGKIQHNNVKAGVLSLSLTDQFLGQIERLYTGNGFVPEEGCVSFEQIYLSQFEKDGNSEDQFYSIVDSKQQNSSSSVVPYSNFQTPATYSQVNKLVERHEENGDKNYLKIRHPTSPLPKTSSTTLKIPKQAGKNPFFEDEFKITNKGELVCINTKKIDAQKGILGQLAKSFGRNLFGGKSIMDISMPVKIFAYESHLSVLCKSNCYAPIMLQEAAKQSNPETRLKYIVGYALGCNNAYILMDKPFNPILGQTYHCMIDGCPVYGEQISHHPPISSIFMKGRGYTVYGSLESKVNLSINSATGSNAGVMSISFNEKDIKKNLVKFVFPGVQVGGVMWGQRTLKNVDKAQYLDEQNRLFLELTFAKHKGSTQFCKYQNGVEGKIVKLKPGVDTSTFPHMKIGKKDIERQCGIISGKWTQFLLYEHQNVINFAEEYPPIPEKYPGPLQSDAFFRKDLLLRIQQRMQKAQLAKEELQGLQRNDRKLRKAYAEKS